MESLETWCSVGDTTHKRPHSVRFLLYEMSKVDKSIKTESRCVVGYQGLGQGWGNWDCFIRMVSNFRGEDNVLELDRGSGCIAL